MDLHLEKLKLIEWLAGLQDEKVVERIKSLRDNPTGTTDWWNDLSQAQKDSIDRGLKDAAEGRVTPHDEVKKRYDQWL